MEHSRGCVAACLKTATAEQRSETQIRDGKLSGRFQPSLSSCGRQRCRGQRRQPKEPAVAGHVPDMPLRKISHVAMFQKPHRTRWSTKDKQDD